MRSVMIAAIGGGLVLLLVSGDGPRGKETTVAGPHRRPAHLALLPDGRHVLTANQSSDSVSLVDLHDGTVVAEERCGRKPIAVACSHDGKHAAVCNLWAETVTLFDVETAGLRRVGEIEVGTFPRSVAYSPDGSALYVAVAGADEVVQIDGKTRKVAHRWPAPREPRLLALSPDGKWLAAASSRNARVYCWNTQTRQTVWQRRIEDGFNLHGLSFSPDGRFLVCAHEVKRSFPISRDNIDKGWAIDSRLTRFAVAAEARPDTWQIALDTRGAAVCDPQALGWTPDGATLAVAAAGTHELLLIHSAAIGWSAGDPGDFIDPALELYDKFHRVPLGGRPTSVAFPRDGTQVIVANSLRDAVQVVDVKSRKLLRTIALGGPMQPSLERKGEALFYDAQRSHNQWFSCHTCHVDGHTSCTTFDTLNDESYGNPKITPTLRNVTNTGPWTWHGWQKDLGDAVTKSMTETMFGPEPKPDDVKAVLAFLATLEHPQRPAARRGDPETLRKGKELFAGKAGCVRCHRGENYTATQNYDVKLEEDGSPFTTWNPPSLRGLWDRGPYLHDGRADTIDEVLDTYHQPERLGGKALTPEERKQLVAFLKSLD